VVQLIGYGCVLLNYIQYNTRVQYMLFVVGECILMWRQDACGSSGL